MLVALELALAFVLFTIVDGITTQYKDLDAMYQSRWRKIAVVTLAEELERYNTETGSFPASVSAMTASAGYEHGKSSANSWQGYAVSPAINDGVWLFKRTVLFSNNPIGGVSTAAYLAANSCGTGGYDTATSWCGDPTSHWYRSETREQYQGQIVTQKARMNRMLQKLADYYNVNSKFPDKDAGSVALATNSMTTLKSLAGYGGTAGACTGTYTYMGVPVDCGDMFDQWGSPVGYQFVSSKHVILVSETPIFNTSGTRIVVSQEYDYSLL